MKHIGLLVVMWCEDNVVHDVLQGLKDGGHFMSVQDMGQFMYSPHDRGHSRPL